MKLLLDDGDQQVGGHGAPDLRLHCVLAGAQETLDAQVLLDPLEEQLDLPTALVQVCDRQGGRGRVVGEEDEGAVDALVGGGAGSSFGEITPVRGGRRI